MLKSKFAPPFCSSGLYHNILTYIRYSQSSIYRVRLPCAYSAPRRVTSISCSRPRFRIMSHNSSIEYCWIDGVERLELYEPGGYHPVMINDLLHNRYRIVDKLGFGGYSTIWLVRDEKFKCYLAVKIGISSPSLPQREHQILRALHVSRLGSQARTAPHTNACAAFPRIFDSFDVRGPNGTHTCYTLTPAQGSLKEASFSRLFPIQVARALAAKLTIAVAFVHSQGFVHGGLFCCVPKQSL